MLRTERSFLHAAMNLSRETGNFGASAFWFELNFIHHRKSGVSTGLPHLVGNKPQSRFEADHVTARWGLVPYWSKDEKSGYKCINARAAFAPLEASAKLYAEFMTEPARTRGSCRGVAPVNSLVGIAPGVGAMLSSKRSERPSATD